MLNVWVEEMDTDSHTHIKTQTHTDINTQTHEELVPKVLSLLVTGVERASYLAR